MATYKEISVISPERWKFVNDIHDNRFPICKFWWQVTCASPWSSLMRQEQEIVCFVNDFGFLWRFLIPNYRGELKEKQGEYFYFEDLHWKDVFGLLYAYNNHQFTLHTLLTLEEYKEANIQECSHNMKIPPPYQPSWYNYIFPEKWKHMESPQNNTTTYFWSNIIVIIALVLIILIVGLCFFYKNQKSS